MTPNLTDKSRTAGVDLMSFPGTRNARYLYVVVEETLGSGNKLRTYFDVNIDSQLTILPKSFFDKERQCLDDMTRLIDHINDHYSKSVLLVPAHVPRTKETVVAQLATLQATIPDLVDRAARAIDEVQLLVRDLTEACKSKPCLHDYRDGGVRPRMLR